MDFPTPREFFCGGHRAVNGIASAAAEGVLRLRGFLRRRDGAGAGALSWYRIALRTLDEAAKVTGETPNRAPDLYDMADVLAQLGRTREAAEAMRQAKTEDPDGRIEGQQRREQR